MDQKKLLAFLDTYRGRDRILRLLSYASKCAAGLSSPNISPQLDKFSKQLSTSRTVFRLLDDIPAISYLIDYAFGNKDEDKFIRLFNVIGNIVDVIFCPIDHISWAVDHGIIVSYSSTAWDTLNTTLWVASLYLNIMSSMRKLGIILDKKIKLADSTNQNSNEMKELSAHQFKLILGTLKSTMDILFAVNYLPPGILWAGSLKKWQVGALGSLSSAIALYQSFR